MALALIKRRTTMIGRTMKVTHHRDGTYSLTGLTRLEVSDLVMAASCAASYYCARAERKHSIPLVYFENDTDQPTLDYYRRSAADHLSLDRALSIATAYDDRSHLPSGASMDLAPAANGYGPVPDVAPYSILRSGIKVVAS